MITLLVVDDHPIVREGLVAVLNDQSDFEVVGAAGSAEEAIPLARRLHPAIVLLDLEMPGRSGIEALPGLLQASPESKVIVFTAYGTDERVLGALYAGAKGYLLKGASADEIARAVRAVHAGGSYLEPRAAATVLSQLNAPRQRSEGLSAREREVLRLVADGQSNKQIARALGIAEPTVKFHITSIFNKLGADNRAQAVSLAIERGLL